jgi:ABC-type branched-subunit amino acid transport system substrate-binding protein
VAQRKKHGGRLPSIVQLLGSSGWHDPGLLSRGGRDVEGAYLIDDFVAEAGDDAADEPSGAAAVFTERWQAKTGRAPTAAAAQAWDATFMALGARRRAASADDPRAAAAQFLSVATLNDGACGPAKVDKSGELVRGVVLLRVEGGEFVVQESIE